MSDSPIAQELPSPYANINRQVVELKGRTDLSRDEFTARIGELKQECRRISEAIAQPEVDSVQGSATTTAETPDADPLPEYLEMQTEYQVPAVGDPPKRKPKPLPETATSHTFAPMLPPELILADPRKVNGTALRVYAWLLMDARGGLICRAGQRRMASELRISVDAVQRALAQLEGRFLSTNRDSNGNADTYKLLCRRKTAKTRPL